MLPKNPAMSAISRDPSISAVIKCVNLVMSYFFFNILDHSAQIIRQEFSESKSARKITCEKTKTATIVNCIRDNFFAELKQGMQENPFSIMLDGSNDTGLQKLYSITLCIYDVCFNQIITRFFNMNLLEGSTAESKFESVAKQFSNHNFSWYYCMVIGLHNTNANIRE